MGWVKCEACDDYLCEEHEMHAHECECPPVEAWYERNLDPYAGDVFPPEEIESAWEGLGG